MHDLSKFYQEFDNGTLKTGGNSDDTIPDGKHLVQYDEYKSGVSKSGNAYELYELVILSENSKGLRTSKYANFNSKNEKSRDYAFKEAAIVCGVNGIRPAPFSGEKLEKCVVWADFVTKDYQGQPHQNIYILNESVPEGQAKKDQDPFANA